MTRDELSTMLNGREYIEEVNNEIKEAMEGTGLVVVFGGSDDLMEFHGAIDDEVECYNGGKAYLDRNGLLNNECNDCDCPYFEQKRNRALVIEALWCAEPNISWTYKTDIPHSTFEIMEAGEVYCRGIVFKLGEGMG